MVKIFIVSIAMIALMSATKWLLMWIEKKQNIKFIDDNWTEENDPKITVHSAAEGSVTRDESDELVIEDDGTCNWLSRTPESADTLRIDCSHEVDFGESPLFFGESTLFKVPEENCKTPAGWTDEGIYIGTDIKDKMCNITWGGWSMDIMCNGVSQIKLGKRYPDWSKS